MQVSQKHWTEDTGFKTIRDDSELKGTPQLVFVFGGRALIEDTDRYQEVKEMYPESHILMCSSAGEIIDTKVRDNTLAITAVHFDKAKLEFAHTAIEGNDESESKGKELGKALPKDGLVHTMVFSDGLKVNGTALVNGITSTLPKDVSVTGGLVGDGADFKKTAVGLDAAGIEGDIVLIGFYGDALRVGYGSLGGWDPFGPERTITRSEGNVLFELDGKPALKLYKEYLGDQAEGLPGTGLQFPLKLTLKEEKDVEVVRTLLAVSEEDQSLTFAGDMPEAATATFMKANFERLVDGAAGAAIMSGETLNGNEPDLAILISCVGRKLVLKEGIEEETEAVRDKLGEKTAMTGFYSYGEVSPVAPTEKQCRLHNQTMTITTFKES